MPKAPKAKSTRPHFDPYARSEPSNRTGASSTAYTLSGPGPRPNNDTSENSTSYPLPSPRPSNDAGDSSTAQPISVATLFKATAAVVAPPPPSPGYLLWTYLPTESPPCISRMLCVPSTLTFTDLQYVLQTAFGWSDSHTYFFEAHTIANKPTKPVPYGPDPTHVMTLEMDETASLKAQAPEEHMLRQDEVAKLKACSNVKLSDVFGNAEWRRLGVGMTYLYEVGDGCEHFIQFLGPAEPHLSQIMGLKEQDLFCFGGEGHPCIEDCEDYGGFEELKKLLRNPQLPDPQGMREWYTGGRPGGLDPWKWDIVKTNKQLKKLRF